MHKHWPFFMAFVNKKGQCKFAECPLLVIFTRNYELMINPVLIINQLFEMQGKLKDTGNAQTFERNFNRLYNLFEEDGYMIQDPTGEAYSETRTDYEASISGQIGSKLKITRTIKPIIYQQKDGALQLVQRAVVIAGNE